MGDNNIVDTDNNNSNNKQIFPWTFVEHQNLFTRGE